MRKYKTRWAAKDMLNLCDGEIGYDFACDRVRKALADLGVGLSLTQMGVER